MVGNIDKDGLREALGISPEYRILLVLALGKPKEEIIIEDMGDDEKPRQWWDEKRVRHVSRRSLDDIIIG